MIIRSRVSIFLTISKKWDCRGLLIRTIKPQFAAILSLFVVLFVGQPNAFSQFKDENLFSKDTHKKYASVRVDKVLSADTLLLATGEKIHLIGLDSPEVPRRKGNLPSDKYGFPIVQNESPTSSIEEQAYDFVRNLLEGKSIRLEFDVQKVSGDFKTLAYVFLSDGVFVNAEILRNGFANLKIIPPNLLYVNDLREAYQEARREKRGLQGDF